MMHNPGELAAAIALGAAIGAALRTAGEMTPLLVGGQLGSVQLTVPARFWPLVSALLLSGSVAYAPGHGGWLIGIAMALLLALAAIDADTTFLPDVLILPLLLIGGLYSFVFGAGLRESLFGALIGYGSVYSVNMLTRLRRGTDGMGWGDAKLLGAIGVWVGPGQILLCILGASGLAITYGVVCKKRDYFPFGPFIAAAGSIALFLQR